jgi:thiol-disulfide isomerase/thioredoxin
MLLTGCGVSPTTKAAPEYKLWSVSANGWQNSSLLGKNGAIVIAMASWCKYCAWEAKWQEPQLFHWGSQHHVQVVLIDISPRGGIGIAGPANDPGAGTDGKANFLGDSPKAMATLESTLKSYSAIYHVPLSYLKVDPNDVTPFAKNARVIPAVYLVNKSGAIVKTYEGTTQAAAVEAAFPLP